MQYPRSEFTAVWTGRQVLIWGGLTAARNPPPHGEAHTPATGKWAAMPASPLRGRAEPVAVWTGRQMIIWGERPGAAAARFRREGLEIPALNCQWADLPAATDERFDAVLCIGNSLVHAASRDAMVAALTGLRRMTRPGGHVVVDSRNWAKLHAERQVVQVADRVVARDGRRCMVLYAWEFPERLGDEHIAHLTFVFDDGGRVESRDYPITFRPFTLSELRERLELAGLREVDTDFDDARDRYSVVTVAA